LGTALEAAEPASRATAPARKTEKRMLQGFFVVERENAGIGAVGREEGVANCELPGDVSNT